MPWLGKFFSPTNGTVKRLGNSLLVNSRKFYNISQGKGGGREREIRSKGGKE